jgi:hypothetical protein
VREARSSPSTYFASYGCLAPLQYRPEPPEKLEKTEFCISLQLPLVGKPACKFESMFFKKLCVCVSDQLSHW